MLLAIAAPSVNAQTLPPPSNLSAVTNGNDVELSWSAVANIDGYRLYYGTKSGSYGPAISLGAGSVQTFADLPVGNYYVALSARKGVQESVRSAEIAVSIQSPLAKPVNFMVVPAGNAAQLSWGAVRGADSYTLWYGSTSGSYAGSIALGKVTAAAFSSLPNGKYYLRIGARAGTVSGPLSDEITAQFPTANNGVPSISALSVASITPFDVLSIAGTGFSPATSAISVLFTNKSDGNTVSVPVVFASATRIDVVVPPLLDAATRRFFSDEVSVSVVQVGGTVQQLSNAIGGLVIGAMPLPDSTLAPGLYSKAVIMAAIEGLEATRTYAIRAADGNAYRAQIDAGKSALASLSSSISTVMATGTAVQLPVRGGGTVAFSRTDLAYLDQLLYAWVTVLQQAVAFSDNSNLQALQIASEGSDGIYPALSSCSTADEDPTGLLAQPCQTQRDLARVAFKIQLDMPKYAKVAYGGILTMSTGMISGGVSALVGAGTAMRVGISVLSSWAVDLAGGSAPTLQGSVETTLSSYADELLGVPVLGSLQPFLDLWRINHSFKRAAVTTGAEPAAGIVVNKVASSPGTGKVALLLVKPQGMLLSKQDQVVTVPTVPVPDPNTDKASLTITSASCVAGERFSWGTLINDVITVSGQTSGPVGTWVWPTSAKVEAFSCSAWTECERKPGQPATTSFSFKSNTLPLTPQWIGISAGFIDKSVQVNCPLQ